MKFQRPILIMLLCLSLAPQAGAEDKKKILFYRNPMQADVTSPMPAKDSMGMDYIPVYAEENKAPAYFCPMHPQVVSDKPGDCPICHMRLVLRDDAVETKARLDAHSLKADPKTTCVFHNCPMEKAGQPCPMLVMGEKGETVECPVCKAKIQMQGELTGSLLPAGYAEVLISTEKQQLIGIRTAPVQKKALKRSLSAPAGVAYDPELYALQVDYLKEYRNGQVTRRNREVDFKNLTDSRWEAPRIDQLKAKLIQMGMDEEWMQEIVDNAKADETLLYLKPDGDVWVYADVMDSEAQWLRKGDPTHIVASSVPGKAYEGAIHGIASFIDPTTRRVRIHIRLKNDGFLKPGMLMNAVVDSSAGTGITVPEEAVFFTGRAAVVFVDKGQGLFEPRQVEVGIKSGEDYEIRKGLAEGEKIVINGNFLLDSESRLKASIEQAIAAQADEGAGHD